MKRLEAFGWGGVVVLAWVAASPVPAGAQCQACIVGCTGVPEGYLICRAGSVGGVPFCSAIGACSSGGGYDGDIPPKLRRPLAATAASELRVYELIFRCGSGGRQGSEPGETARLLTGAARPFSVPAVISALKKFSPAAAGRLALASGVVMVGPGYIEGANLGADGSGYDLRLVAEAAGTRMSVCSVKNEVRGGPLAQATVGPGDLLVVQVSLDGSDFLCVLSPMPVATGASAEGDDAANLRHAFFDEVASAWRLHWDPGLSLRFVPLGGASCP